MIQPVKHLAVNWVDGMKISQKHFEAQENYFLDTIRDANSLFVTGYNYGLLPQINSGDRAVFEVYNTATNDVQLIVKNCSALTAAGYRIEISDYTTNIKSLGFNASLEGPSTDSDYYILVSVNPFEKVAIGELDPDETPPRRPNATGRLYVELVPVSTFESGTIGGSYLVIGKVSIRHGIVQADETFIPPCTSLQSHQALLGYYSSFAKKMGNIQQYAFKIVQKTANVNQNSNLAKNVKLLCNTLIGHFANIYFGYRNIVPHQPPVFLVDVFSQQALHLYNATQSIVSAELEEMLHYTFEWSEIAPHALVNQLSAVAEIRYNHNDCAKHFVEIDNMLKSVETIFKRLSDLDYIGQRKENIIVNEQNVTPNSKNPRGWSVLD